MEQANLYIVATPIGNLEDITYRAVAVLRDGVGLIVCEDTRQTKKLLDRYGIDRPLASIHAHSTEARIRHVIHLIQNGTSVAYVTDSGTPGLSDPGGRLVSAAREEGIRIIPIPGPSALTAIVSVSGQSGSRVTFGGFLSKKEGKRNAELAELGRAGGTIVLYESPYRIKKLLASIGKVFPGCRVLIGREMTKIHEEFLYDSIEGILSRLSEVKEKGEFTVAILLSR